MVADDGWYFDINELVAIADEAHTSPRCDEIHVDKSKRMSADEKQACCVLQHIVVRIQMQLHLHFLVVANLCIKHIFAFAFFLQVTDLLLSVH